MANADSTPVVKRHVLIERAKKATTLKVGNVEISFEPDDLDEEFVMKARKELRETDEVVAQALMEIRQLVKGDCIKIVCKAEVNLRVPDDDEFYIKFLRPCKWYAAPAFNLMKNCYRFRINRPRVCKDLVPSNERTILSSGIITPLPIRCKDGVRLLLIEGGRRWKPKEISLDQILRGAMLALEAATSEPKTQVAGVRTIFDMDGLSLNHVTYFTPSFASTVLEWIQKCLPTRIKGIHVINQPYIFNMVFAVFKPFIQEKLRKRIHFHGTDRNSLMTYIDAFALPKRYGGELDMPSEPIGEPLWNYFCNFEEEFQIANTYGYITKT